MPPSEGEFKAGGFAFPTSTGSFSVTGLEFEPQGVIFFGSNQATMDTLLHPTAPGMWFGMAWIDYVSKAIDTQSQAWNVSNVVWASKPITCISTGTTVEYQASSITFDADGFTLNVTTAAPGSRIVHYLAWGGWDGAEGKNVASNVPIAQLGPLLDVDLGPLGYRPFSALAFDMFAAGATRDSSGANAIYFTLGTANFYEEYTPTGPGNTPGNNAGAMTMYAPLANAQGLVNNGRNHGTVDGNNSLTFSVASGLVNTWSDRYDALYPYPTYTDDTLRLAMNGWPNVISLAWWDCEGSVEFASAPDVGVTIPITPSNEAVEEVQAALFFGSNYPADLGELGVQVAYVLGVLTPDYQGLVVFDTGGYTHAISGTYVAPEDGVKSLYQSQAACFANSLSPGGGIRVASGSIVDGAVSVTGTTASNPAYDHGSFVQLWGRIEETPTTFQRRRYVGLLP